MKTLLEGMNYVGILAMKCFVDDDRILVNELAPRVHNSGHWTQRGDVTSQFENHLRALFGLPLGGTALSGYVGMVNILGERPSPACYAALTGNASLHWYNKEPRPGRKLGHLLVSGVELDDVLRRLAWVQAALDRERSALAAESANPSEHGASSIPADSPPMPASQQRT